MSTILITALLVGFQGAPTYTNDDLERVAPFRGETGGSSEAALPVAPPETSRRGRGREAGSSGHDVVAAGRETYWRKEARRVRDRMQALDDKAVALRQKIEDRRAKPGVRPYSDPQIRRWEQQASELLERSRSMEIELLDRARREGALPGWLR